MDPKAFQSRERGKEQATDLRERRKLPVRLRARDTQLEHFVIVGPILLKEADLDAETEEDDVRSTGHVESFCATEKIAEL